MLRKRFTEEQIIRILHEAEAVGNVRDVCRQHNIAEQTLYRWRRQFGGMEVAEAKRLRALARKNAALKRLIGALTLDNRMLKDVREKKWYASRPGVVWQPLSSRRTGRVNGVPAVCWACTAVPNAGSQGPRNARRWLRACMPSRSAIHGVDTARFLPC